MKAEIELRVRKTRKLRLIAIWFLIRKRGPIRPYNVYRAGVRFLKERKDQEQGTTWLEEKFKGLRKSVWKLTWDDLKAITEGHKRSTIGSLLRIINEVREDPFFGELSEGFCSLCWRYVGEKTLCEVHKRENKASYMQGMRMKPTAEKVYREQVSAILKQTRAASFHESIEKLSLGEVAKLCGIPSSPKKIRSLNAPEEEPEICDLKMKVFAIRAGAWRSLMGDDGKSKVWGGRRPGAGRPKKSMSPSCHPEKEKSTENERNRSEQNGRKRIS